jgi:hypothetical protein
MFWIPVRIPGSTRQATRAEMAALFAEQPTAAAIQGNQWELDAPVAAGGRLAGRGRIAVGMQEQLACRRDGTV